MFSIRWLSLLYVDVESANHSQKRLSHPILNEHVIVICYRRGNYLLILIQSPALLFIVLKEQILIIQNKSKVSRNIDLLVLRKLFAEVNMDSGTVFLCFESIIPRLSIYVESPQCCALIFQMRYLSNAL